MQDKWNTGHVGCRTGEMQSFTISRIQDMWDAGQVGCRTSGIQEVICWTGGITDRWDAGQVHCRKAAGKVRYRTGRMQVRWNTGQRGCRSVGMQDCHWTDAGKEGFI